MARLVISLVLSAGFLIALSLPFWLQAHPEDEGGGIKQGLSGITTLPDDVPGEAGVPGSGGVLPEVGGELPGTGGRPRRVERPGGFSQRSPLQAGIRLRRARANPVEGRGPVSGPLPSFSSSQDGHQPERRRPHALRIVVTMF